MGAVICPPGCACQRHRRRTLQERLKLTGRSPCEPGCACSLHSGTFSGRHHTADAKAAMSKANIGSVRDSTSVEASRRGLLQWHESLTEEERRARSTAISEGKPRSRMSGRLGWTGGDEGEYYASILCPLGYVRELQVNYGPGTHAHYKLDFALAKEKINIELDGPYHDYTLDAERDARLRALGWKVVRIDHS